MSAHKPSPSSVADDPEATQMELVHESARLDGVEIVHYQPRYPTTRPKSKSEKRIERTIALCFVISGLAAVAFVGIYGFWDWKYQHGSGADKWYTPLLGTTMGLALLGIGFGILIWSKKLLPVEESIQEVHHDPSDEVDQRLTVANLVNMGDEVGVKRRPLLKGALAFGLLPVGVMAVAPLGALIKKPKGMFDTGFAKGVRLVRLDGSPVRPDDVSTGGIETVFPGVPHGTTNKFADSPTILMRLRPEDAAKVEPRKGQKDFNYGDFYAYSKICTHAGCPASLYEQQTNIMLCPCHQSQFDVMRGCEPMFGPATRPLPQLPITVDDEGFFVAKHDFVEAIGPAFWERP